MSRRLTTACIIDGVEVPITSARSTTGTEPSNAVASGSITIPGRRPNVAQPGASVVIYAGYDGNARPIFTGTLADDEASFSSQGKVFQADLVGHSNLLTYPNEEEIGFTGPMSMNVWWRSMCNHFGVPTYHADATTDQGGTTLMLGDNPDVGAFIPIRTEITPLRDMVQRAQALGYRHFDTPDGTVRLQRVSGLPTMAYEDVPQFAQGVSVMDVRRRQSFDGIANWWDVWGAEYQAVDTSEVAIRSFPESVTENTTLFGPSGIARKEIRDRNLDTVLLADACRNAFEVDYSTPQHRFRWTCVGGDNERYPGEQVAILSPQANWRSTEFVDQVLAALPRVVWLTRVDHSIGTRGFTTVLEGWAGNGAALPAGNDCVTTTLLAGSVHVGNETLSHYRNPSPVGLEYEIGFTALDDYTTATIRFDGHGCNSFVRNTESTASRYEIWQGGDRVMSGEMPRQDENLELRLDYDLDSTWAENLVVPLTGRLDAGPATLKIISGKDSDVGDHDDYEVKNVRATFCGVGKPVIV